MTTPTTTISKSVAYEYSLISGILCESDGWETALESVEEVHFSVDQCRQLFAEAKKLHEAGVTISSEAIVYNLGGYDTDWPLVVSHCLDSRAAGDPMTCVRAIKQGAMRREIDKSAHAMLSLPEDVSPDAVSERLETLQARIEAFATGSGSVFNIASEGAQIAKWAKAAQDTGFRSGILTLDDKFRPAKGLLTVVTGAPGSGKSEFLDALMVRLAMKFKLRFAVYSPENFPPAQHAIKLLDKILSLDPRNITRATYLDMDEATIAEAMKKVGKHFSLIDLSEGDSNLDALIDTLDKNWSALKADGFVVDPWNELEARLRPGERETDYIGRCLARLRRWARKRNVMLFVVAHPTKLKKDDDGNYVTPTPYDISGSANWYNKADNALAISRKKNSRFVEIHVQKIKQKIHGERGMVQLIYDNKSGMYYDRGCVPALVLKEAEDHDTRESFDKEEF